MTPKDKILNEGWEKRTTTDEPRLSELVRLYDELGFEVLLVPFNAEEELGCSECMKTSPQHYRTIYTRKKP